MIFLYLFLIGLGITYLLIRHFLLFRLPTSDHHKDVEYFKGIPSPVKYTALWDMPFQLLNSKSEDAWEHIIGMHQQTEGTNTYLIWVFGYPYLILYGAEQIEQFLRTKNTQKSREYDVLTPWMENGLITNNTNSWRFRRKLLTPSFHFSLLSQYVEVFRRKTAKSVLENLMPKAETGETFDFRPFITGLTLDNICEALLGQSFDMQNENNRSYATAVDVLSDILRVKMQKPWLRIDLLNRLFHEAKKEEKGLDVIHKFAEQVIEDRWTEAEKQQKSPSSSDGDGEGFEFIREKKLSFLDLLVEMGLNGQITKDGIKEELNTFIFAGHDTTTMGLCWTLFLLGHHPEYQQEIQAELDTHIHSPEDYTLENMKNLASLFLESVPAFARQIENRYHLYHMGADNKLNKLLQNFFGERSYCETYVLTRSRRVRLEQSFKEGLRLFPSVPMLSRRVRDEFTIDGAVIPVGTTVGFCPFLIHRDPNHWPDQERFDPDRFLPENTIGRHPFCYVPFSAGTRNCIGRSVAILEAKIVIGTILQHFTVRSHHKRHEVQHRVELVIRPDPGIFVTLEKRQK